VRSLLRTVTPLILAAGLAVAGATDALAAAVGAGTATPPACTGTIQITSLGFSPTAIAPGQTSAAGLTVQNCTTQAQQTTTMWVARFVGPGTGIPPGCPGIDPLVRPANVPAGMQLSLTTTYLAFQTCTATGLQLNVQVIGSTGTVLATQTANLTIGGTTAPGCLLIPPPAPGNLTVAAVSSTSATLTWLVTAAPGCSFSYEILRAPGTSGGTFAQVGTATGGSFTDTGLTPNTIYRYQARTRDAAGNLSALSNTVTATTGLNTSGCAAAYRIVSAWGGAFQGEVTVTNTGNNPINGWRVTLTLSGAASISQIWGGRTSQTASPYTVANETWNAVLGPTATATFGFNANVGGSSGASGTVSCAAG
jgi:chitodextrinase